MLRLVRGGRMLAVCGAQGRSPADRPVCPPGRGKVCSGWHPVLPAGGNPQHQRLLAAGTAAAVRFGGQGVSDGQPGDCRGGVCPAGGVCQRLLGGRAAVFDLRRGAVCCGAGQCPCQLRSHPGGGLPHQRQPVRRPHGGADRHPRGCGRYPGEIPGNISLSLRPDLHPLRPGKPGHLPLRRGGPGPALLPAIPAAAQRRRGLPV